MDFNDSNNADRKSQRRMNFDRKKTKPKHTEQYDYKDQQMLNKQFKKKKRESYQDEMWEEWRDEIY